MLKASHKSISPTCATLLVLALSLSTTAQEIPNAPPDVVELRVKVLRDRHVERLVSPRNLPCVPGGLLWLAKAEACWEHGPEALAIPFEAGELEEIGALIADLLDEEELRWPLLCDLTLCLCQRPTSKEVIDSLLAILSAACRAGRRGTIDYALIAMAYQTEPRARNALKAAALLPLEKASEVFPTIEGEPLPLDLRQYIAWCACQAKIMRTKRDEILPWMKPIASSYGIDRGAYNSQETKDEHIRAIETFLYQAEQIAVDGDPWAGFLSGPFDFTSRR